MFLTCHVGTGTKWKKKEKKWLFINHQGSIPDRWSRMAKEKEKKQKKKNERQQGEKKKQSDEGVKKKWLRRRKNGQISASAFLV